MSEEVSTTVPESKVDQENQSPSDASQQPTVTSTTEQVEQSPSDDPKPASEVKQEKQSPAADSQQSSVASNAEPANESASNTSQPPADPSARDDSAQTPVAPPVEKVAEKPSDDPPQTLVPSAVEKAAEKPSDDSPQTPVAPAVKQAAESPGVDFRKRSADPTVEQAGESPSDSLRPLSAAPTAEQVDLNPLNGYQQLPVVPLEDALKDLMPSIPTLAEDVSTAKKKCHQTSTLLTVDESAAIYLYTMASPFIYYISVAFQIGDRNTLRPWLPYLKLFTTAVEKLPATRRTVWRGLGSDDLFMYPEGTICTWWQITSCSINIRMAEDYLVKERGTLFAIDAIHAKDISTYSAFPDEQEIILLPGTRLRFVGEPLNYKDSLSLIHLQEENESPAS